MGKGNQCQTALSAALLIMNTEQEGGRAVLGKASTVVLLSHESKPAVFMGFPVLSHYKAQKPRWHFNRKYSVYMFDWNVLSPRENQAPTLLGFSS